MSIPIRCFSCGKNIAHLLDRYEKFYADMMDEYNEDPQKFSQRGTTPINEALNRTGIKNICCRRMFMCNVDLTNKIVF